MRLKKYFKERKNVNINDLYFKKKKMRVEPKEELTKFEDTPKEVVPTRIVTTKDLRPYRIKGDSWIFGGNSLYNNK